MAAGAPKVGLLMRGWNEIPEIIGSSFMALVGIGFGVAGWMIYDARGGDVRKYKLKYTVYRPDDPRVATIRKHSAMDD